MCFTSTIQFNTLMTYSFKYYYNVILSPSQECFLKEGRGGKEVSLTVFPVEFPYIVSCSLWHGHVSSLIQTL